MEFKSLFLLLCITINLGFGIYIIWQNPKKLQNRVFSLFIFVLVIWSFINFLISISHNVEVVTTFGKFAYAIGSIIPVALAIFIYVFPQINKNISTKPLYLLCAGSVLFIILSFTSLIQESVQITEIGLRPVLGSWYLLFAVYEGIGMIYCLWFLYKKWKLSNNKYEQLQVKFNFFGFLIATSIALIGTVILPMFNISAMIYLGPTVTVVIIGFTTYTIVRYRLFDITIIVKKTAIYTLLTGSVTAVLLLGVLLAERIFRMFMGHQTFFFSAVFAALLVTFIFLPLREKIQTLVDKMFGKKKYEYQRVLKQMGRELSRVLPLPRLLKYILKNITDTMGIDGGVIYLREANKFKVKSLLGNFSNKSIALSKNDSLIVWMTQKKDAVIKDEWERISEDKQFQDMKNSLGKIGADLAMPIIREDILTGIIFLKNKSSGDMFTEEDIDLLLTLANHAGVAIENARLYTQVEQAKLYQENILKNLANAVIVTDKEDKIRIFNEKAQQMTGISASLAIGKNYKKILPDEFSQAIVDVEEFGKGFSSYEIEYIRDKKKADADKVKPMILGVGTAVIKGKNNRINGVILVLADLTEIRTLERQLNRAEELATVGTLAAGMAHEIKNPLVAINTFFELLPQKYDDSEFRNEFSASACEEVKKIDDLIHRLLNFAQPKSPNFTLNHIHKCIDENLKFMSTKLNSYGIKIIKKYAPDIPENYIDKTRFDEILLNLLLNAIEVMENGGKLYITTSYEKTENGRQILLKIQDTGIGIPAENLSRVFDPFFTTKDNGTGLGLAIVYRAVIDHGGNIAVESEAGKGTTFLIYLPIFLKAYSHKFLTVKP
ncbi:MAG: GAF domain-containing protein [Candidatus Omnitrophica bacterium]|nr:GAF domain-containing protein [Candidatus Omnitrophota bacterium]